MNPPPASQPIGRNFHFKCSRCDNTIAVPPSHQSLHIACPRCGHMNTMPDRRKKAKRRAGILLVLLSPFLLVGAAWLLTIVVGSTQVRSDLDGILSQLRRGGSQWQMSIKSPRPFALTARVTVAGAASYEVRRYYYWRGNSVQEIPESEAPEWMTAAWR